MILNDLLGLNRTSPVSPFEPVAMSSSLLSVICVIGRSAEALLLGSDRLLSKVRSIFS